MRGISGPEFEVAISAYRPDLLRWAIGQVGVDDAEDLVQDTLVKALAIQSRPRSSLRTWLFAIAHYEYLERERHVPPTLELVEGTIATDLVGDFIARG